MNKLKRLLSFILILTLIVPMLPSLNVKAEGEIDVSLEPLVPGSGEEDKSKSYQICGYGVYLGLHQTDEPYTGSTDEGAFTEWVVNDYTSRYYCDLDYSKCYYAGAYLPSNISSGNGKDPFGITYGLVTGNLPADYIIAGGGGYGNYTLNPEKTNEVMSSFATIDPANYRLWVDTQHATDCKRVILAMELVLLVKSPTGEFYGYSVADCLENLGVYSLVGSDWGEQSNGFTVNWKGLDYPSVAKRFCADYGKFMVYKAIESNENSLAYRALVVLLDLEGKSLSKRSGCAAMIAEPGVHVGAGAIAVDGTLELPPGPDPDPENPVLTGEFEFDLNSYKIPTNSRGYKEDGTAVAESVSGDFELGFINLKSAGYGNWEHYVRTYGDANVTVELVVHGVGTNDFSTVRSEIIGSSSANTHTPGVCGVYSVSVPMSKLAGWMKNGSEGESIFPSFPNGNSTGSTISGTPVNGTLGVAYACELRVTVNHGPIPGVYNFTNNQVHYAIYTFEGEDFTYKLSQNNIQGWAQLKSTAIGNAAFEATTGTPTTEDLFISMGGNTFIANLQYRYCIDDYIRTYQVHTATEYPNFMYYNCGDGGKGEDAESAQGDDHRVKMHTSPNTSNYGWTDRNPGESQKALYDEQAEAYWKQVKDTFSSIDENYTDWYKKNSHGGADCYDVIILKEKLKFNNSSWQITNYENAVVGADTSLVSDTKEAIKVLNEQLAALKSKVGKLNGFHDYDDNYSALAHIITMYFFKMSDEYADIDSKAKGAVKVVFKFDLDNTNDYTDLPGTYYNVETCLASTKDWSWSCANGSGSGTVTHASHTYSPVCSKYEGSTMETSWSTSSHNCQIPKACDSSCDTNGDGIYDCTGGHTQDCNGGTDGASYSCNPPTDTHHGRGGGGFRFGINCSGGNWGHSEDHDEENEDTQIYAWGVKWSVTPNYCAGDVEIHKDAKDLSYEQEISQVYKDVKYMDIIDCHLWRLSGGVAKVNGGLDNLLVTKVNSANYDITPIIEMACASNGFTFYNVSHLDNSVFATDQLMDFGNTSTTGAWSSKDPEYITAHPRFEEAPSAAVKLQEIGRLANSFNAGTQEPRSMSPAFEEHEHSFRSSSNGDIIELVYDVEEQGGKSDYSFNGFIKQALALTFYKDELPENAFRNYIAVQSDYVTVDNQGSPFTFCGFMFETKSMDKPGKPSQQDAAKGLTQAILNTQESEKGSYLVNYVLQSGEFWTKQDNFKASGVNDDAVNLGSKGLNGCDVSSSTMTMPNNHSAGKDTPNDEPIPLINCQEGNSLYSGDGFGAPGVVRLEQGLVNGGVPYNTFTKEFLNEQGSANYLANFYTEGKNPTYDGTNLSIVGYVGLQDSIQDLHVKTPSGSTTAFLPSATLISGGFNGVSFAQFGVGILGNLLTDNGSSGVTGPVSACESGRNTIVNKGLYFPYVTGLNVLRNAPNNNYGGYSTALVYDEVMHFTEAYAGVHSTELSETVNTLKSNSFNDWEKDILSDFDSQVTFENLGGILDPGLISDISSGTGIIVDVGYGGKGTKTNPVTIYNPSTAINAAIVQPTELLPDGTNNFNSTEGYTERDQRLTPSEMLLGNGEVVYAYTPFTSVPEENLNNVLTYKLKERTDYNGGVTEYYTTADYIGYNENYVCDKVLAGQELVIPQDTSATMTIMSALDKLTTVSLNVEEGDVLYTDYNSAYLRKASNKAPDVKYSTLVDALNVIYSKEHGDVRETVYKEDSEFLESLDLDSCFKELTRIRSKLPTFQAGSYKSNMSNYEYVLSAYTKLYKSTISRIKIERSSIFYNPDVCNEVIDWYQSLDKLRTNLYDYHIEKNGYSINTVIPEALQPFTAPDLHAIQYTDEELDTVNGYLVEEGVTLKLSTVGTKLSAGSVLKVTLPLNARYNNPVNFKVTADVAAENYEVYFTSDGNTLYWYIEAFKDMKVSQLTFEFLTDVRIAPFEGSCLTFEDIWLFDIGTAYSNPAYAGTTLEHNVKTSSDIFREKTPRARSFNKHVFSALSSWNYTGVTLESGKLFVVQEKPSKLTLKPEAANNPHKVYNANWKHYVLGWLTDSGHVINTVDDAVLSIDETVICWPNGGTITVKELKEQACLVKYNGAVYLTTKEAGLKHVIRELNVKVPYFDIWSLTGKICPTLKIDTATEGSYPLQCNVAGKDLNGNYSYQSYWYEFFFALQDTDACLFNVEYSTNPTYRFEQNDTSTTYYADGNRNADYTVEYDTEDPLIQEVDNNNVGETYSAEYISLDDEFSVYFDNVGKFPGNSSWFDSGVAGNANAGRLGYGWNATMHGLSHLSDYDFGISDWYGEKGLGSSAMECTTWIQDKYLTFSHDVYVFKKPGESSYNPTLRSHNKDGSANIPVLIKKGEKVHLGKYTVTTLDDNMCSFTDYGAPSICSGDTPYTYYFWCPLATGEGVDNFTVYFNTVNINGDLSTTYATVDNNLSVPNDPGGAQNAKTTSVVGRIGALTIADTGDPRYSDTFKVAGNDYLLYPIVRKIAQYTNDFTDAYIASLGSQRGVVLDPFDVRGRVAQDWSLERVKSLIKTEGNIYQYYKPYVTNSYNTYSTQWFKQNLSKADDTDTQGKQHGAVLPLSSEFNKHETFKTQPLKIGYELYTSIETIGSYRGQSSSIIDLDVVNGNNDVGHNKIQIRPFYSTVDAVRGDGKTYSGPVDVYMRLGNSYILINSGCGKVNTGDNCTSACLTNQPNYSFADILQIINNNAFPSYIETNSLEPVTNLDENMCRRMVTDVEAAVTERVLSARNLSMSLLTKVDNSTEGLGGMELDTKYCYGNSQMLFLRERNMTYVGGETAALNGEDYTDNMRSTQEGNAQKYYFGLGLPSSAVFVPHGEKLTGDSVLVDGYVLNSISTIAKGEFWLLNYESDVSKMAWEVEGRTYEPEEWNPWIKQYPWLVPVTYYDMEQTSLDDVDTEGSH